MPIPVPPYGSINADGSVNRFDPNTGLSTAPSDGGSSGGGSGGSSGGGGSPSLSTPINIDSNPGQLLQPGQVYTYLGVTYTQPGTPATSNIVQDTTAQNTSDANVGNNVDNHVTNLQPVPNYGDPVIVNGQNVGSAAFNPNTGQPLYNPNAPVVEDTVAGTIKTPDGSTYNLTPPAGFDYQLPALPDGSKYVYTTDGKASVMDEKGKVVSSPAADAEWQKNKDTQAEIATRNESYDSYKIGLDASFQAGLDNIKAQAAQMTANQQLLNKMTLGAKTVQGYRTGSTEYTPEISTGILKAEQEEGLAKLNEIQVNTNIAIMQAVSAKNDKDFALAQDRLDTIDKLRKAKEDTILAIYKNYVDNNKAITDQIKALETANNATKDQALQQLPVQSLQMQKDYDALKTPAAKEAYINSFIQATGLSREDLLGQFQKNTNAIKTEKATVDKPTEGDKTKAVISDFSKGFEGTDAKGVKLKGADGYVAPEDWQYARQQWGLKGGKDSEFISNFKRYLNPESYDLVGVK